MWKLRIFIDNIQVIAHAHSPENGLRILATTDKVKLVGPLTHQPYTRTIFHNGNPCGCYYWEANA